MKLLTTLFVFLASLAVQAQVIISDGQLYLRDSQEAESRVTSKANNVLDTVETSMGFKKVNIGLESIDGEIAILSDLIVHQGFAVYVVNPVNGKISRIDLDEKSEYYGSVEVVSGLVIRHNNNIYLVNPTNGKTKLI